MLYMYVCMHMFIYIYIHAYHMHIRDTPVICIQETAVCICETPLLQAAGIYISYVYTRHLCHRRQEDKQKKHKAIKTAAKRKAFKEWHWGVNAENIFGAFIHTAMHEGCLHAVKKCGAALTLCTIIQVQMYMRIYKYT